MSQATRSMQIIPILALLLSAIVVAIVAVLYNEAFLYGALLPQNLFIESPKCIFLITPPLFFVSAYLCRKFAPNAAGSGAGHVVTALKKMHKNSPDATDVGDLLNLRIIIIAIISSIICVAGYGALGREGPIVQIGASIFLLIGQKMKSLYPDLDLGTWVVAGSAAGLAAAFNAPLAGIIFIAEELSHAYSAHRLVRPQYTAFFAVILAEFISNKMTGDYLVFNFQSINFDFESKTCIILLLVACVCAITALLMQKTISIFIKWRASIPQNLWYLLPILCGLLVATVGFCVGSHAFGPGIFIIQEGLQSAHHTLGIEGLLGRLTSIIAAIAAGCAGGILLPSLALGANVGSLLGSLLPMLDSRIFVVAGMASFLGAAIRSPLTASVLVVEITGQSDIAIPLLVSALVASWIFGRTERLICNN